MKICITEQALLKTAKISLRTLSNLQYIQGGLPGRCGVPGGKADPLPARKSITSQSWRQQAGPPFLALF